MAILIYFYLFFLLSLSILEHLLPTYSPSSFSLSSLIFIHLNLYPFILLYHTLFLICISLTSFSHLCNYHHLSDFSFSSSLYTSLSFPLHIALPFSSPYTSLCLPHSISAYFSLLYLYAPHFLAISFTSFPSHTNLCHTQCTCNIA